MDPVLVSAITYVHGEPLPVAELDGTAGQRLTAPEHGLEHYRVSAKATWRLAADAGRSTLQEGPDPDLLLYASEYDEDHGESIAALASALQLPDVPFLAVGGHGCGNLGPALSTARALIVGGGYRRILLITADRAGGRERTMDTALSVLSDGAAACLVTAEAPGSDLGCYQVDAVTTRSRITADRDDDSGTRMLATAQVAADGMCDIAARTGRAAGDFHHLVLANYRLVSQRFFTTAMGFTQGQLLVGDVAGLAHCFSADVLVTLEQRARDGTIRPGQNVLVSATGNHTWWMAAVRRVR